MHPEHPHTLEDRVAERLAKIGTMAAIISLFVLLAVLFGNVLVLAVKVAVNAVLAVLVNLGPAVAALLGGISTAIGYYGRTRLLRRKEKFNLRDEVRDQGLDQAGNALQNAPATLRSRLGCSSSLSFGVFVVSLILCFLTYLPPPLHVFGANIAATATPVIAATTPTATIGTIATATATAIPTTIATTVQSTVTPTPAPSATNTPTRVPTATPVPPPGQLLVQSASPIALGSFCNESFTGAVFTFTNDGGTTIYWTVRMPTPFSLEQNYPTTGSLQPNEGDSQNEYFQGTKSSATIMLVWGYSANNEPSAISLPVTCQPVG